MITCEPTPMYSEVYVIRATCKETEKITYDGGRTWTPDVYYAKSIFPKDRAQMYLADMQKYLYLTEKFCTHLIEIVSLDDVCKSLMPGYAVQSFTLDGASARYVKRNGFVVKGSERPYRFLNIYDAHRCSDIMKKRLKRCGSTDTLGVRIVKFPDGPSKDEGINWVVATIDYLLDVDDIRRRQWEERLHERHSVRRAKR